MKRATREVMAGEDESSVCKQGVREGNLQRLCLRCLWGGVGKRFGVGFEFRV